LPADRLGENQSGMGMDEATSTTMPLPSKGILLDYARRAFEAANSACAAVDEEQLAATATDLYGMQTSVGAAILSHLGHANRHLGMIEALKGVQGARGTATA
jgi:hypothetical protein